jgi:hypothetical protein
MLQLIFGSRRAHLSGDFVRQRCPVGAAPGRSAVISRFGIVDEFSARYGNLLTGSYDCIDRIVPNAYLRLRHSPVEVSGVVAALA